MSEQQTFFGSSGSGDEWPTPKWVWYPPGAALGGYDLDVAAGCEPEPIAPNRFTKPANPLRGGLVKDWHGHVWMNHPYGKIEVDGETVNMNPKWASKAAKEFDSGRVDSITALVPAATEADWYLLLEERARYMTTFSQRLDFGGGDTPTFDSVLLSLSHDSFPDEYVHALKNLGRGRGVETEVWTKA